MTVWTLPRLAAYVAGGSSRLPVVAFIAGRFVDRMPGQRFGHAAVMVEEGTGWRLAKVSGRKRMNRRLPVGKRSNGSTMRERE